MSELNREQIIEALECHANDQCCVDCPYTDIDLCHTKMAENAFALINELTAENERLRAERDIATTEEVVQYDEGQGLKVVFYANGNEIGEAATVNYNGSQNAFLHGLEVKAEYRNKGYGSRIISYMIAEYGVHTLYVSDNNSAAIHLYEKHGFYAIDRFVKDGETYLVMTRDVSIARADTVRKMQAAIKEYYSKSCYRPTQQHPVKHTQIEHLFYIVDQIAKELLEGEK